MNQTSAIALPVNTLGTSSPHVAAKPAMSIRVLIACMGLSLLVSCGLIVLSCYISHSRLDALAERTVECAGAAQAANELETALATAWREHTHWQAMGHKVHRESCEAALSACTKIAQEMQAKTGSQEERALADRLYSDACAFAEAVRANPPKAEEGLRGQFSGLLARVQGISRRNVARMYTTAAAAESAHARANLQTAGLVAVVSLLLGGGVFLLIRRIAQPALELSRAARRFGQGDLSARAAVWRLDELGEVGTTFNWMAERFESYEEERLHFIATVAHDLKSPLVVIGGAARLLKRRGGLQGELAEWLDRTIVQATRLERLADELMERVQVATGRFALKLDVLDLTEFLRSLCREEAGVLPTHRIVFEGEEACQVLADASRIERVARNLLSNAAKYSPEGSTIRVAVKKKEGRAAFVVQDEGAGMVPEEVEGLFKPFQRSARTRDMAAGTGLGLSAVKKIVDAHGGTITVRSTPGAGTAVEVGIPYAPAARPRQEPQAPGEAPS